MIRVNNYRILLVGAIALLSGLALGCEAPGVGDPCTPEIIPAGGFNNAEAYLETSSVQCRTRVCLVYKLAGYPDGACPIGEPCASQEETDRRIFCSCRCRAPAGSDSPTCECGEGYSCEEVLDVGDEGARGSYCIKNEIVEEAS